MTEYAPEQGTGTGVPDAAFPIPVYGHVREVDETTDDVRADARRLLLKHTDKSDLSLDAPTSLDDIRDRLARCTHGCRCDDGDHENAVHDLASSDVPVLLAAFEDALAVIANIREQATDVDQDGGHSGPTLARHILNIIGGEA